MALLKTTLAAGAFALALAVPAHAQDAGETRATGNFAAGTLAKGRQDDAIRMLERECAAAPDDAAILINLGIAYAQAGEEERAADLFEAALVSDDVVLLQTASGEETDSRRLARKAMRMLRDGEFRPASAESRDTLSLRD
jgi:tetratricopeptide (TPR) repeat protein